ncbi:alpha/beta hydrolase [Hoeflea sp. YIM 152468]|uniref:alpha/beta hydrolase n=1 Tax=Hoeflea sp. YIM 152468 TaxID=3031759 RepID=UPI0023DB09C8|nr:alpha/beta hydrolase [Hoeflea sp. YIM 152468]MDF1608286.1 alpha/beta hydrolase [Hoeflea sp. YIM 152468]
MPITEPLLTMGRTAAGAAVVGLALSLAGCASPPEGVLSPVAQTAPDATEISIMVATTRAPSDNPGLLYSGERGNAVDFNELVVSIPPEAHRKIGEVQWPKTLPADPSREFATLSASRFDSVTDIRAWYQRNKSPSGRLLIFVHGFNTRYESAVYRFAQIAHDSRTDATPVMFTWPSRGSVFDYGYDKESTNYSRSALETLLTGAAAAPEITDIIILAHSMGTWLAMESLRQMAIRNDGIPSKIGNVILASPDLDVDVFSQQLADMGSKRPKFTVFVSQDDRALTLSRRISGNVDRLGQIDIHNPVYRDEFERGGITILDLSALQVGDSLNHSKFAESPEVVKLLGQRLIDGQAVTEQDLGLGAEFGATAMSVSNTVGSAAGMAISAPIAILDPKARNTFDAQSQRFGRNLGNSVRGIVDPRLNLTPRCTRLGDIFCVTGSSLSSR